MEPVVVSTPAVEPTPATPAADAPGSLSPALPTPANLDTTFEMHADGDAPDLSQLVEPAAVPATAPAPVVTPATPATVAPAAPAAPAATPAVAATPAAPVPVAPGAAAPASPTAPVDVIADLEKNKDAIIGALAQEHFTLSEAEVGQLTEAPNEVISKVAARVFYMANVNAMKHLQEFARNLPAMIMRVTELGEQNRGFATKFYEQFPDLKGKEATVVALSKTVRESNPGITQDQFIEAVGRTARAMLGLQAPAAPTGVPVVQPRPNGSLPPFRPAPAGVPVSQQVVKDPFLGMGMDFSNDEN